MFEFDQNENEMVRGIMAIAANSVAAVNPAYAPAASLAAELGGFLLAFNTDDIVTKMTFALYPWPEGPVGSVTDHFGVPRLRYDSFAILNVDAANAAPSPH